MFCNERLQLVHSSSDTRVTQSEVFTYGGDVLSISNILHVIPESVEQLGFERLGEYISDHEVG